MGEKDAEREIYRGGEKRRYMETREECSVEREKKTDANHIHTIVVFAIGINSIMIASMFLREEGNFLIDNGQL